MASNPKAKAFTVSVQYDRRLIGDGTPGKLTNDLIVRFKALANSTGTPVPYS